MPLSLRAALLAWLTAVVAAGTPVSAGAQSVFSPEIAIKLPRGANHIHPDLALVYDQGNANGIIGVGWTLRGLPAITRVNYGYGINFNGADTYSDSNFGILVRQPDGSYRSKRESFVKFVPSGICFDGPCSWVAQYPSGVKYIYAEALYVQNSTAVRTWAVSSVVDLYGNSYDITYIKDTANGQLYPDTITYTKAANLSTYRTVVFSYETRTDTEPGYYQNAFHRPFSD